MTLPTYSSSLALSQIQGEFGGSNPIYLSEYYAGKSNGYVQAGTTGGLFGISTAIPSSGALRIGNFHGSSARRDLLVTLTGTGNYTVPTWATKVDILIVAGGGSGGSAPAEKQNDGGGGGGAGGVIYLANQTGYAGGTYSYSVGAGGAPINSSQGRNGSNTVFYTYTAIGGGGGGGHPYASPDNPVYYGQDPKTGDYGYYNTYGVSDGLPGGSGGGGNAFYGQGLPGAGTSGQGNAGGTGAGRPYGSKGDGFNGGGGGYASVGYNNWPSYGAPGSGSIRYTGGAGTFFTWYSYTSGANVNTGLGGLGGGGGAGSGFGVFEYNPDNGVYAYPIGGGGNGALLGGGNGQAGTAATGGGGGGGWGGGGSNGGAGGSGVIYLFLKNY